MSTQFANDTPTHAHTERPFIARAIHRLAVPIILGWVFVTVLVNVIVPRLEVVGEAHSAPMAPLGAVHEGDDAAGS